MNNETYISGQKGSYKLINGNAQSVDTFETFDLAQAALHNDNELQELADFGGDPDLYNSNSIDWE